jgi:alpha-galactosidase
MKNLYMLIVSLLLLFSACQQYEQEKTKIVNTVAEKPPMGWNSFDAYDCAINEKQFKDVVDWLADNLLEYGWEYAVVDYIWWHPEPGNWDTPRRFGHPNLRYKKDGAPQYPEFTTIDDYGRLWPAPERFPSAADGKGFKPLADYAHSKGMKFGIHIMRGIHRVATFNDSKIMGTNFSAQDICEPWDTCPWCNHMLGVDPTKPGAQEYYNSLFNLYAQWEVDYVKADDMTVPPYHKGELELIRNAIEQCGRPMVLSLSPGETPLSQAKHLKNNANLWRISADLWDEWGPLLHSFDLLNSWSSWNQPHHWPDADMIPIGHLSMNGRPHGPDRMSHLTWPEHYTLMSLWCIARSPLMWGGGPLSSSEKSISFLKNKEVLAVNQNSLNGRQIFRANNKVIWMADIPQSKDKYFALFNLADSVQKVKFEFEFEYLRDSYKIRDLWAHKELGVFENEFAQMLDPHGAGLYKMIKQ